MKISFTAECEKLVEKKLKGGAMAVRHTAKKYRKKNREKKSVFQETDFNSSLRDCRYKYDPRPSSLNDKAYLPWGFLLFFKKFVQEGEREDIIFEQ